MLKRGQAPFSTFDAYQLEEDPGYLEWYPFGEHSLLIRQANFSQDFVKSRVWSHSLKHRIYLD